MTIVFSIKNKKSLFGYQKVLAANEVLKLVEGLISYNYDPSSLHRSLNDFESLNCILFGKSGLPLQLRYVDAENAYQILVSPFAIEEDWQLALRWMSRLAELLGTEITSSEGGNYSPDSIFHFDYEVIILETLGNLTKEKDLEEFEVQGFAHPVYLDRETVQEVLNHVHPLEAYSAFIKKIQYSAAYFSQVRFYQQEETRDFLASYSLTEETDTVLPRRPHVPAEYVEIVGLAGVSDWRVLLVAIDGDPDKQENYHPLASVPLKALIEALEPNEYQLLDANQIEIKKLSKERLLQLAQL
ncbi:hypothetical protein HMPREF9186_00817 [Streptococcus sp. F0442]|uniref:DUF4299 family protein n=1 Tax=unclassified Streptococcus TaxID=2608887 RepID=UPI0002994908|nr:DUF4299 family protein [Streptococcus sp. F0442]EKS20241.1 hypothetical protein HMPREF9186_00817 [Streptococcus sp. F0442]